MKFTFIGLFIGLLLGINNLIGLTQLKIGYYLGLGPIVDSSFFQFIGEGSILTVIIVPAIFYALIGYTISRLRK